MDAAAVSVVSLNILKEGVDDIAGDLIYTVVVIAVFWKIAFHDVVYNDAVFIPDCFYLRVFDGDRESATTERPAIPVANQRVTLWSWRAIWSFS